MLGRFDYSDTVGGDCYIVVISDANKKPEVINSTAFSCTVLKHQKLSYLLNYRRALMGELCLHFARSSNESPSPFIPVATAEENIMT